MVNKGIVVIFWGKINNKYSKSKRIPLIKRTSWTLPCIIWETPITEAPPKFYTDANKSVKAGYKPGLQELIPGQAPNLQRNPVLKNQKEKRMPNILYIKDMV